MCFPSKFSKFHNVQIYIHVYSATYGQTEQYWMERIVIVNCKRAKLSADYFGTDQIELLIESDFNKTSHDRTEKSYTASTCRGPIQSLRKVF